MPEPDSGPDFTAALLTLTVVTGLVDAVSYLALGHVFVANMTGNVVFLFRRGRAPGFTIASSLLAVLAFLGSGLIGGRWIHGGGGRPGVLLAGTTSQRSRRTRAWRVAAGGDRPASSCRSERCSAARSRAFSSSG